MIIVAETELVILGSNLWNLMVVKDHNCHLISLNWKTSVSYFDFMVTSPFAQSQHVCHL